MRREIRWLLVAVLALGMGSIGAEAYARHAAPFYSFVAGVLTTGRPWRIISVDVRHDDRGPGSILMLVAELRRTDGDPLPAARVVTRLQVGEVVEAPLVFWTLVLLWPAASLRRRMEYCLAGLPVFLGLETVTTVAQLLQSLPEAAAILAGDSDPMTWWERYSRFLEGGGRFVLEIASALLTVAIFRDASSSGSARAFDPIPEHAPRGQQT